MATKWINFYSKALVSYVSGWDDKKDNNSNARGVFVTHES